MHHINSIYDKISLYNNIHKFKYVKKLLGTIY